MLIHMKEQLNGMFWSPALQLAPMRTVNSLREGLFLFQKNSPDLIWNTLGTFENNPCTLAQAETILQGVSVEGLSLRDLDQVRHFGSGCRELQNMLDKQTFCTDKRMRLSAACHCGPGRGAGVGCIPPGERVTAPCGVYAAGLQGIARSFCTGHGLFGE